MYYSNMYVCKNVNVYIVCKNMLFGKYKYKKF